MKKFEAHILAPHTTMHVGGIARQYVEVESVKELMDVLTTAKQQGMPVFVLGAGSNTLIDDSGFDGIVIHPAFRGQEFIEQKDGSFLVKIYAGAVFDDVVSEACKHEMNLGGIESLSGIPGSAGGSLVQNIGAYGQEISEVFVSAEAIHRDTLEVVKLERDDMQFGYRCTALKTPDNPLVISSMTLRLEPFDSDSACRRCIERSFKRMVETPPKNALELRKLVLETRRSKSMFYDENDINSHSVGSFFVNPVVSAEDAERLKSIHSNEDKPMPTYETKDGVKLSAAWLIEHSGYERGHRHGGAALSEKHCLAIVNRDNASSADVIELAQRIVRDVYLRYKVTLRPEVVYLSRSGISDLPC